MKVAVFGATGNLGTSIIGSLSTDDTVTEIVGIARRTPDLPLPKVTWKAADVTSDDLVPLLQGIDAVVHLAWRIQPSHDREAMRATNVGGSRRVFEAAIEAGVKTVVYASSIGAYSPGPKVLTDESHSTGGIQTSRYSVDKAEVERLVDIFEKANPDMRWVRMRPGLVFKRESGAEIRRMFLGSLVPVQLLNEPKFPVVPKIDGLEFQAVHASDVGNAFHLAVTKDVRGAFNLASEPVFTPDVLAHTLQAKLVPVPRRVARSLLEASWHLHAQPTDPGWLDLALDTPLMDTTRARKELGWVPQVSSTDALLDVFSGMIEGGGFETPPLHTAKQRLIGVRDKVRTGLKSF